MTRLPSWYLSNLLDFFLVFEVVLTWRHLVQLCCEDEDQAVWLLARHHGDSLHSLDLIGYCG